MSFFKLFLQGCLSSIIMVMIVVLITGWIVMLLWNWLMPEILGLKEITILQAYGLTLLGNLMFSRINFNNSDK